MGNVVSIQFIIVFYTYISMTLLIFNIFYIFFQRAIDVRYKKTARDLFFDISLQLTALAEPEGRTDPKHQKRIVKQLSKMSGLIGYCNAMQRLSKTHSLTYIDKYLKGCYQSFCHLAMHYVNQKDMEKAFLAFVISQFPPKTEDMNSLEEYMLHFLLDTNMYCRDYTLHALCAFESVPVVSRALEFLAEHRIYCHEKMLAQALMSFTGDREMLAAHMVSRIPAWPAYIGVSVVQLIETCRTDYRSTFFDMLSQPGIDPSVRSAMLQYFETHPYEPVRPILIDCLKRLDRNVPRLSVAAASALCAYPGSESVEALLSALCGPNWYVRASAARSLLLLGVRSDDFEDVLLKDPYALDMMCYQAQSLGLQEQVPQCALKGNK